MNTGTMRSILRLALDSGAADGEWRAAAIKFIELVRKHGGETKIRECIVGQEQHGAPGKGRSPAGIEPWRLEQMPFGKYRGLTVDWIAANDPGYLEWLLEVGIMKESLANAIADAARHYGI